jgi:hypothetical protein
MRFPVIPVVTMAMAVVAALGQSTASLRARELFYTPPPDASAVAKPAATAAPAPAPPAPKTVAKKTPAKQAPNQTSNPAADAPVQAVSTKPPAAGPLGIRYSVLKRNAAGVYQEVDVDSTFHSGDRIRLEAQANTTGYLYVVAQGSSGAWQVLFPSREVAGGSNQVNRGETRLVPGGNAGQFVFDEQAGTEKLFFVLSRQPEASLDKLIYAVGRQGSAPAAPTAAEPARVMMAQATVSDDVISRLRDQMAARDLIFEKVDNEKVAAAQGAGNGQVKMETAAYVVNPSTAPDARLVVDVKLKHQ